MLQTGDGQMKPPRSKVAHVFGRPRAPLGIGIIAAWSASALISARGPSTRPLIRIRPPVAKLDLSCRSFGAADRDTSVLGSALNQPEDGGSAADPKEPVSTSCHRDG